MSLLNNLLSSIEAPSAASAPDARQTQAAAPSKSTPKPASSTNGISQAQPLKRKAEGTPSGGQIKVQRKDGVPSVQRVNGAARPTIVPDATKSKSSAPTASIPYRGTAGLGNINASKVSSAITAKPNAQTAMYKPSAPVPSKLTAGTTPPPTNALTQAKKGSYAAMLARAKAAQAAKPPAPPIKHETTKILTKKERMALREQAKTGAKATKAGSVGPPVRGGENKIEIGKEKRKPIESGYQGTARPTKKPLDLAYKGTARPSVSASGSSSKGNIASAAKPKPKSGQSRYEGYAEWSDLDDMDDEEDDYGSDASSDMEGGVWDVEEEEELALKSAKKEDLEALQEENRLKREKEERKRRLAALAAGAKKQRY